MSENVENGSGNDQENSQNSENIQDNSELNQEIPAEEPQDETPGEETPKEKSENDDELDLPEPDISDEEVKKKKEMPEWMKKKLEREKAAADRQAEQALALKQENDRLRAAQQPNGQQQPPQQSNLDPNIPRRDQFNSEEEYFFAVADFRDNVRHQAAVFHQRNAAIQKAEQEYHSGLTKSVEEGKEKYKDFEERVDFVLHGETMPPNRAMGEAIVASEYRSDILYFLGTHVKEAERIASLNPVLAVKEITKIEARFSARKKSNITKAPKIISPLGGNKGSATNSDPGKMGMDEFSNWYKDTYG